MSTRREIANFACSVLATLAVAAAGLACSAYSGCFVPRDAPNEANIRRQVERLRSGPTLEQVLRKFGEDPQDLMTPTDGQK